MRELRALLPYLRPYRLAMAAGLAMVVVSNALNVRTPRYLEHGIDAVRTGAPFSAVRGFALLLVAVALAGGVARYFMRQILNSASRRIETDLRNDLFDHVQGVSAEFHDRYPTGDVMARTTNDLLAVRMVAGPALMYVLDTIIRTALIVPAMVRISWLLAALSLLPLAALPFAMIVLGNRIHRRTLEIQNKFGDISSFVHENVSGVRVVRAYRQERAETDAFRELNAEYRHRNLALARVQGIFYPLLTVLGGLGGLTILYVGGRLVMAGAVTVGAFVAFGVYLAMLVWPMIALGWAVNLVQRGAASMARINELFRAQPAIVSPADPVRLPPRAPAGRALTMEGVWLRYPAAADRGGVLEDHSFHL
ncbi:MAG TPA: ABC transporter transmembrane domain-containing protein, partial [Gemmatimonadales bacterium]|nr:ABC transporter transmembrane domain-containing protein [Gemmatimonadales bacterium]